MTEASSGCMSCGKPFTGVPLYPPICVDCCKEPPWIVLDRKVGMWMHDHGNRVDVYETRPGVSGSAIRLRCLVAFPSAPQGHTMPVGEHVEITDVGRPVQAVCIMDLDGTRPMVVANVHPVVPRQVP